MSPGKSPPETALQAGPVVPEHELLRPIASGAYGQVWLARNRLGACRAVKIVHRVNFDHDRPFEREFAGIKAFEPISRSHDGLVDLLQVGRDDAAGYFYYVMELADAVGGPNPEFRETKPESAPEDNRRSLPFDPQDWNFYVPRTLSSELKRRNRLPVDDCIRIGLSLAQALAYLHRQGLVHRDVKPSNIVFVRGVPKLADVGLVAGVGETRSFVGTEGFIPPEGPGTPQADLYSLGVVLYVLSTGKSHQDFPEPPTELATQPDRERWLEFNAILHKACRTELRERYQSAEELEADLALLQRGGSVKAKRAVQRRWAVARRLGVAACAVSLTLAALPLLKGPKPAHKPNQEAEQLYDLGRWYYSKLTPEAHKQAMKYLNKSVQADPKFAEPYIELTEICVWALSGTFSNNLEKLRLTKEIADKAMAIDPNLAQGHTALSWYHFLTRDWRQAEEEIKRAIALNPRYAAARNLYGFYLSMLGRPAEAHVQVREAQKVEPSSRITALIGAWPFIAERRFEQAIAQLQWVVTLDENFAEAHYWLAGCYEARSNFVAAIDEFKKYDLNSGQDPAVVAVRYAALREAYANGGEEGYFRKWVEMILADDALPEDHQVCRQCVAEYYAMLGDKPNAFAAIQRQFDTFGVWQVLNFEPRYDSLRGDPPFRDFLKKAGLER